ncbi:MAG: hypothetical protein WKF89_00075 [Chitinophagaceae bacterium]
MAKRQINIRGIIVMMLLTATSLTALCQYYYKDLETTKQINDTYKIYKTNKINLVTLKSFQGKIPVTEGFLCEQKVNLSRNQVFTYTKTSDLGESFFTAYYNALGLLTRTTDSSQEAVSTSIYTYDTRQLLANLTHTTRAGDNSSSTSELHTWQYNTNGKPLTMTRIKNGTDSTLVAFTLDEKGNVIEEQATHKNRVSGKYYYYFDEKNRMTDVVRFNAKANRLLPDYMFEYEESDQLSAMTIVPEGSSDYQKWYYTYDDAGLKLVEFCYNKKTELLGKVEYNYTAGR